MEEYFEYAINNDNTIEVYKVTGRSIPNVKDFDGEDNQFEMTTRSLWFKGELLIDFPKEKLEDIGNAIIDALS
jgi:hypothetical protein